MTKSDIIEVLDMCRDSLNELDELLVLYASKKLGGKEIDRLIKLMRERFELTTELVHGVTKGDGAINLMAHYNNSFKTMIKQWNTLKNER